MNSKLINYNELKKELFDLIYSSKFGWVDGDEWRMDGGEAVDMIVELFDKFISRLYKDKVLTEGDMQNYLSQFYRKEENLLIPNLFWGLPNLHYEIDLAVVNLKSLYVKEIEIKISKNDLLKDKNKKHNHNWELARELYYAIPQELIEYIDNIPERAGIISVKNNLKEIKIEIIRRSKINKNARKLTIEELIKLYNLINFRFWNLREKYYELKKRK